MDRKAEKSAAEAIEQASKVLEIAGRIKPLLAGEDAETQGAVLGQLLSLWLASWAPSLREQILTQHVLFVRNLIAISERELFGPDGHPGE